ncbi:protein disulfideisomerase domain containing protein [Acanthamoeba castellanii str. Neff]|uniref:Protein disulfideisomerase domain containing protein n=1 Tax=Acanthamoeba castellanii (strain ATCC 30010 / Neff) TaxID=1257118 RepID=L8HC71_ACACF|nr:protein disulfideisomerase domain containing protein [Acanthamoeba castellanii str. Neff]ELR22795.1 protein disulfideisomerase domain containing protein [Acanthamoeba castellanii str. Neff]
MKSSLCLLAFFAVFLLAGATDVDDSDVVVLNAQNFDAQTAEGTWMIEFYAPWCGHCKTLKPTWAQLATASKGKFNVAMVDGSAEQGLSKRFGIRGFPTIKLIRDGKLYDYNLRRTVEDFTAFAEGAYAKVEAKELPAAAPATPAPTAAAEASVEESGDAAKKAAVILTTDNFDELTQSGDWLVEFYAPWCGHCKRLAPVWDQLASEADESLHVGKVDCTTNNPVCSRFAVRGYPTIKLLQNGQPKDYSGARTVEAFLTFYRNAKTATTTPEKKDEL